MTPLRLATLAAVCAFTLAVARPAASQEAQGARAEEGRKKLTVTVIDGGHGHPFAVSENPAADGYAAEVSPPPRLTGWKRPDGESPLTRIRLRLTREGDAVRIGVAAVLDDSYPADAPGPKYGVREARVASYLAREGETVSVNELKRYGFEPLVLAVAEAKPEPEMPVIPAPSRATSRLKSIEVVSFLTEGAEMERGRVVVRNVSQKNITGLEMSVADGLTQTAYASGPRPLMAPGGTYETEITLGRGGSETPGGFEPMTRPDALVVGTAVFDDGSYEGEVKTAATMFARQKGRLAQLARVLSLTRKALDAQEGDAAAALAGLKSEVAGLRIDPAPELLDELLSKFPKLSNDEGRKLVAESALDGMRAGRSEALRIIEQEPGAADPRRQLQAAWEKIEKRCGFGPRDF